MTCFELQVGVHQCVGAICCVSAVAEVAYGLALEDRVTHSLNNVALTRPNNTHTASMGFSPLNTDHDSFPPSASLIISGSCLFFATLAVLSGRYKVRFAFIS